MPVINPAKLTPGQRVTLVCDGEPIYAAGVWSGWPWLFVMRRNAGGKLLYFECGQTRRRFYEEDGGLRDTAGRIVEVRDADPR